MGENEHLFAVSENCGDGFGGGVTDYGNTAESPGGSGDRAGLPTAARCAWIDDRSIRECLGE